MSSLLVVALLAAAPPGSAAGELRARGVVLLGGDEALAEALVAGLEALPPRMRQVPGGPLELEVHPETSAFGMGDGSPGRPEWTSGLGRFHLYAFPAQPPRGEERALFHLRALAPDGQRRLWRARALIHAVTRRWDAAKGWNGREDFRRLSGWGWLGPSNTYAWAYSRERGRSSPALDLATFAEELFAPSPALETEDAAPGCVQPSKWRFASERLAEAGLTDGPLPRRCPAFEAWADEGTLDSLEVLFVAASGRAVESLFGHVLLRLVRADGAERVRGPSFDTQVQLVALTGTELPDLQYALRGLTGGFQMALITTTFGDLRRELLEGEQRSIRRFRLNLTASERRRALERIWELERTGYARYFFFGHNCADALMDLVDAALEGGRRTKRQPAWWPASPSSALDALGDVRAGDRPLLEPLPGEFQSSQIQAVDAERRRRDAAKVLHARASEADRGPLRRVDRALQSSDPALRARAYAALEPWLDRALPGGSPELREAAYRYLDDSVRIERYAADAAANRARKIQMSAVLVEKLRLPTAEDETRARQRTFQDEARLNRRWALLDRAAGVEDALARVEKRPYLEDEALELEHAARTGRTFARATDLQARAVRAHFAGLDAFERRRREEQERAAREAGQIAGTVARSGFLRGGAGVAVGLLRGEPRLVLRSAVISEPLGERRRHGYRAHSEIQILSGEAELVPGPRLGGLPRLRASHLKALAFRTLMRDAPVERRSLLDALGWGFSLEGDSLEQTAFARVGMELLAVLDAGDDFARHTALGLGPSLRLQTSPRLEPRAGLRASLSHRSALGTTSLVAEASLDSGLGLDGSFQHLARAAVSAEVAVAPLAGRTLVLAPELAGRWQPAASGLPAATDLRAGLRAELR